MTTRPALCAVMLIAGCQARCSPGLQLTREDPAKLPPAFHWDEPPPLEGAALTQVVELASSHEEFCARRAEGSVVCWGNRQDSNAPHTPFPARVPLRDRAVSLSLANGGSCAALHDRSLWCWSGSWLLGRGPEPDRRTPHQVSGAEVTGPVAVSTYGFCAVTGAPTRVRCGGRVEDYLRRYSGDAPNQIYRATGAIETTSSPDQPGIVISGPALEYVPGPNQPPIPISREDLPPWWPDGPPIEQVQGIQQLESARPTIFCMRTEHAVRCFTSDEEHILEAVQRWQYISGSGASATCGVDASGRVGVWYPGIREGVYYVEGVDDAISVDCMNHGCLIHADRSISCFGLEQMYRPPRYPTPLHVHRPIRIEGVAGAVQVAAGRGAACALLEDRTVVCWGANNASLGIGAPLPSHDPAPVYPPRRVRAPR